MPDCETAATMGTVACPPHVTMFRFGASRCSSRFTTGTQNGPTEAGVRSSIRTPVSRNLAQLAWCAVADVASNTSLMSPKFGIAKSPSTPLAVVGTPIRAARAKPSEAGSMPAIAPTVSGPSLRRILIIRSVPMLPEPTMATGQLRCGVMAFPFRRSSAARFRTRRGRAFRTGRPSRLSRHRSPSR
jgi:hypothetical protein